MCGKGIQSTWTQNVDNSNCNRCIDHFMKFQTYHMYQELVMAWGLVEISLAHFSEIDLLENKKKICVVFLTQQAEDKNTIDVCANDLR